MADHPEIEYRIYIPTGFRRNEPTVIVLNQAPWGFESQPLAVSAAEQLNWISVGLPDFGAGQTAEGYLLSNPDSFYVIMDLLSRFTVARRGLIFAGFSEGARRSAPSANAFRGFTGGMIDIDMGAWSTEQVDHSVPVFFIVADNNGDARRESWIRSVGETLERDYTWGRLEEFAGTHSWGPQALHNEALLWLAQVRADPRFQNGY